MNKVTWTSCKVTIRADMMNSQVIVWCYRVNMWFIHSWTSECSAALRQFAEETSVSEQLSVWYSSLQQESRDTNRLNWRRLSPTSRPPGFLHIIWLSHHLITAFPNWIPAGFNVYKAVHTVDTTAANTDQTETHLQSFHTESLQTNKQATDLWICSTIYTLG